MSDANIRTVQTKGLGLTSRCHGSVREHEPLDGRSRLSMELNDSIGIANVLIRTATTRGVHFRSPTPFAYGKAVLDPQTDAQPMHKLV